MVYFAHKLFQGRSKSSIIQKFCRVIWLIIKKIEIVANCILFSEFQAENSTKLEHVDMLLLNPSGSLFYENVVQFLEIFLNPGGFSSFRQSRDGFR